MKWPWQPRTYSRTYVVPPEPAGSVPDGQRRNVFILLDGTTNDETGKARSGTVTNVVKLRDCLGEDSDAQITRYFRGIGNDDEFGVLHGWWSSATGHGEAHIRDAAYATIAKEYRPGDRLFLAGFSRGAASARRLARDLHDKGIPPEITITNELKRNRATGDIEERYRSHTVGGGQARDVEVEFLGAWDTVGAFGLAIKIGRLDLRSGWGDERFDDTEIACNIKRAVHLMAIDETRRAFRPTLMNRRDGVNEVWFAGVHSDVGGGYRAHALGDITLRYMIESLKAHAATEGFTVFFDEQRVAQYLDAGDAGSTPDTVHWHGLHLLNPLLRRQGFKARRRIVVLRDSKLAPDLKPRIHRSVIDLHGHALVPRVQRHLLRPDTLEYVKYDPEPLRRIKGPYEVVDTPGADAPPARPTPPDG